MSTASNNNARDPSGYLTSPPSTVVKVVGTARDDINGLLGIVMSYNMERERYLVHMTSSQSTMALKKENIQKASMVEKYRCQFQQLQNDPRVREKVAHYVRWCENQVQPYKLWHVLGAALLFAVIMLYFFGFTKCLMMTSMFILLLVIVLPDILNKASPTVILQRFPQRSREALEQQLPFLRGKLSDRMAVAIIMMVVAFTLQSLFVGSGSSTPTVSPPPRPSGNAPKTALSTGAAASTTKEMMEKYYHLGFQDAIDGKDKGFSIQEELKKLADVQRRLLVAEEQEEPLADVINDDFDYYPTTPPPPQKPLLSRLFSFSAMGSMFYIYRMLKEKGIDQSTGLFSVGQLAANLQHHTELWQQGMLLFSVYNLMRVVLSW
ncbi:hypothetical protein IV203_012930 [Nitzschia inconspicua]|uniref:Uncharacterized protein n=1 Tax=Nitzschia inconspicua TaxID=303405 RepID=A0A9K3M506_9STRA|nr:hypothetical protein IV203_012930 [Nitzschia inconspicua]